MNSGSYEVVVIGAGHAGCEAGLASARLGRVTLLLTHRRDRVAWASCNPAIGGLAKGHLTREIDAIGGQMGRVTDRAGIQFRRLNTRKGPAVRGTRAQIDMHVYSSTMLEALEAESNLALSEAEAVALRYDRSGVCAVVLSEGSEVRCSAVIVTAGTYLNGLIHIGSEQIAAGRMGEEPSTSLAKYFKAEGLETGRLKTGTPARITKESIDFSRMRPQNGDEPPPMFSWELTQPLLPQVKCYETHTVARTHEVIREHLHEAPLYSGQISGVGPRYCPSIEDKIVRFAGRDEHHVFVEPTGLNSNLYYPNGISTSLPLEAQKRMLHSIPGLEHADIAVPAYAIEYDFYPPTQLHSWLESRAVPRLFFAGQINGTSGYEEAAGQGLVAGLNAHRLLDDQEPVVLGRDTAYIGVMLDDLTTMGTEEPYRMFTSRAEHRLLLREANAEKRLTQLGREWGLVKDQQWQWFLDQQEEEERSRKVLEETYLFSTEEANANLVQLGFKPIRRKTSLAQLLARPELHLEDIRPLWPNQPWPQLPPRGIEELETELKFSGYIQRGENLAKRLSRADQQRIPRDFDYSEVRGLSNEAVEKLSSVRPENLGQASRIPGITPAAVASLLIFLARD